MCGTTVDQASQTQRRSPATVMLAKTEDEQKLRSRLLNTYYFARTNIEEQGVGGAREQKTP
jgi:hypothetical protein